jgi:DNA-binding SARP family transcriptional activator
MALKGEQLQIQLLGELRVSRNGVPRQLPPSKKTRALLGYLLLSGRSQRRELLCRLLWDVADDPRGALRWSLSKLRPLLDEAGIERLTATREAVGIELVDAEVDVLTLTRAVRAAGDFAETETSELEAWAGAFAGELLAGLDLPDFDQFQAFCLAQREELRRVRVRILTTLAERLREQPERALPHVRDLVTIEPLALAVRARLLTLLQRMGRSAEVLQQYQAARRLFAEHGSHELAALDQAFQQIRASRADALAIAPAAPRPLASAPSVPDLGALDQHADRPLPDVLSQALRARLSRLGSEAAEALRWAAVLDGPFVPRELASFVRFDAEALVSGLEELEHAELLTCTVDPSASGAVRYGFAHERVRALVYDELSPARRQLMHGRVARALYERCDYREEQLSRLVRHATLAHDQALAAEACVVAGTHSLRLFAYAEASAFARRGLEHCAELDGLERIRRSIELHEIQLWCAARGEEEGLVERIRRLGDEAHAFGAFEHARRAHKVLSYRHLEDEAFGSSQHHSLMAELISRDAGPHDQLASLAEAGRCMLLLGREHTRARGMLEQAETLARRLAHEPAVLRDGQGLWHVFRGEHVRAARCFEQAAALANVERNRLIEFQALEHRVMIEFERGDFRAAARFCAPLSEVARSLRGSELPFAQLITALAAYALDPKRIGEVEERLEQLRSLSAQRRLMHALATLAELDVMHEKPARALRHAREGLALAERLERPNECHVALSVIAWAERRLGNLEQEEWALARLRGGDEREVAQGTRRRVRALLGGGPVAQAVSSVG